MVWPKKTLQNITEDICSLVERFPGRAFLLTLAGAKSLFLFYIAILVTIVATGIGLMGVNHPVGWGTYIITFVFWIGIGHAGTLISAILFLFRQKWRTSIARTAEAMTVFAVMTAGIFPLLHTGRPWFAYWLLPYPNQRGPLWVNFRSPLVWDVFAVSTYATVSIVFWYIGMLPDLATLRDRAKGVRKYVYGVLCLGWRGTARHWSHFEISYMLLAALSTPLVLSVHSIVSFDFATASVPGWHTTIFPPYFVAGAIFSGFGMVISLMCLIRFFVPAFKDYVTLNHMETMNKIILLTGMMVGYAYASEFFIAWYSGSHFESYVFFNNRATGPYWWSYWTMILCNVLVPQVFWFKRIRRSIPIMFVVSVFVNIGMWFERYVIVVTSLHRDFLPANWGMFDMTFYDFSSLIGSFGMFFTLFLLYLRFLPAISISEVKMVAHEGHSTEKT